MQIYFSSRLKRARVMPASAGELINLASAPMKIGFSHFR
jgi:hypothetical protein